MLIKNQEKQIIQDDKQDIMANTILDIKEAGDRMCQIQNGWQNGNQKELEELEQEVEEGYKG